MELIKGLYFEIFIALGILVVLFTDMFLNKKNSKKVIGSLTLLILFVSLFILYFNAGEYLKLYYVFKTDIIFDKSVYFFKSFFILGAIFTTIFSLQSSFLIDKKAGEFFCMILGATLGAIFVLTSFNLILFYLGFEMLSICSYIMAGAENNIKSKEASYKYALYGAISSAIMIVGFSYIYGLSGSSLNIGVIVSSISDMILRGENLLPISLSCLLVFVGIGYKISAFPFHFWAPDVYEGAPVSVSAFLSTVSKITGLVALLKFIVIPISIVWYASFWSFQHINLYQIFFGILGIVTVCFGNIVAIKQENLKRLMAYSSIAHAGYMILCLSTGSKAAINAVMFYMLVYFFMNFVIFYFIVFSENYLKKSSVEIMDVSGIGKKVPVVGVCVFIALISLAGIPPTAGFSGKFLLFDAIIQKGLSFSQKSFAFYYFIFLAIVGILNSVISLYYYMKIAKSMFFYKFDEEKKLEILLPKRAMYVYLVLFILLTLPIIYFLNFSIAKILFD